MSNPKNKDLEEIVLPNNLSVFEDKKTGVKTVAFPFMFPSGASGVVSVTKLKRGPWKPSEDIETVQIIWNKNKQFSK